MTYDWQQRCNSVGVPPIRTPEFLNTRRLSWRQFGRRADSRALIVGVLSVVPATAQYTTASLGGTVADPAGAVVPEAEVTVQNEDTGLSRTITSQPDGTFLFPALPVGHYKLTVTKSGFATYVQTGIVLTVNETATQTVALQVRTVSQEVNVSANAEVLPTRTSTVSQLIDNKRVVDLPLDGGQPQELLFMAAGTVNEVKTAAEKGLQQPYEPPAQAKPAEEEDKDD